MSLKGFHIVFALSVTVLCLFLCAWSYYHYSQTQIAGYLLTLISAVIAAIGTGIYGFLFYKKINIK